MAINCLVIKEVATVGGTVEEVRADPWKFGKVVNERVLKAEVYDMKDNV